MGLLLGAMPSAQAATTVTIDSVTLDKASVAVSGLNTVPVKVTVKAHNISDTLFVILERTGGSGQLRWLLSTNLPRTSGTVEDGVWSGPLNVPSTANGTFKVTSVFPGPYLPGSGDMTEPTPYDGPSIAVTGTHIPKITAKVSPNPVPFGSGYSIRWAVTDSATGKPYGSRLRVALNNDNTCVEYVGPGYTNLTDIYGVVTKSYPASYGDYLNCLLLPGNPAANGWLSFFVLRPGIVSATPSKTSAPVGTIVPVNGSVAGAPSNCKVWLQRLYGATQWRSVSSGTVRQSGRFTVNAQPAYQGLIPYRVYFPKCYNFLSGVSKVFYIRGT